MLKQIWLARLRTADGLAVDLYLATDTRSQNEAPDALLKVALSVPAHGMSDAGK